MRQTAPSAPSAPVEPENRLVARTLEARWEARLAALAEAEQALEAARDALPPLPSRDEPRRKSPPTCPALWHAPATSASGPQAAAAHPDRRRHPAARARPRRWFRIGIRWHTGATDELCMDRPVHRGTARRSPSPAVEMVRQLGPVTPAAELAGLLNAAGLTTGHGRPFDAKAVQWIRHAYHIPALAPYADGEISAAEAARRLSCSAGVIYDWIQAGQLDARARPGKPAMHHLGRPHRRPPAASASPHPGTSTPRPAAPGPAAAEPGPLMSATACHAHASRSSDLA